MSQEVTVRTDMEQLTFEFWKGVRQGCILSPCLFTFCAEYIIQNARLDESQGGIKIAGRNINNLRHADDTTLMAESQEKLKRLLMRVKEESEKFNIQKTRILVSSRIASWQIEEEKVETVTNFIFLGSKVTTGSNCSQENKRCLLLGRKTITNLYSILKSRDITWPQKGPSSQSYGFFSSHV